MKGNTNMTMDEKIFEALLKIATDEALREEMDALPSDEELNKMYPRTKSLDKKVNAVIKREYKTIRRKKALHVFARVVAGFGIFAFVSGAVLMSVEASRNFILNSLIDVRNNYVAFDFGVDDLPAITNNGNISNDTPVEIDGGIILGYVPAGFELVSSQAVEGLTISVFADDTEHTLIIQRFVEEALFVGVDNDHMDFREIQLDRGTVHIFQALEEYDRSVITWKHEKDVIKITTTLDAETLIKTAENLIVK